MEISIAELIRFYDTKEHGDAHAHVSAITGMVGEGLALGLLKHYFINVKDATSVTILPDKPREILGAGINKNNGKRLDGWIIVEASDRIVFYQTEIKNWSAHSIAGYRNKNLAIDCDPELLKSFADYKFTNQWSASTDNFSPGLEYVSKVLKKMETPKSSLFRQGISIVEPLICYWYPISPKESFKPFYSLKCDSEFAQINFFSMSLYLRDLYKQGIQRVQIDVPVIEKRLDYLRMMFS
jgi:hypothetical protein